MDFRQIKRNSLKFLDYPKYIHSKNFIIYFIYLFIVGLSTGGKKQSIADLWPTGETKTI